MVNMENYEEYMLLYADGELGKEEEQELLAFVAEHPQLQAELNAYAATRLQPDTGIVFADKESLLKTEGGSSRAIWPGNWKTYAAAASVILFITFFTILRNTRKDVPVVAEQQKDTPRTVTESIINQPELIAQQDTTAKKLHSTKPVNAVAVEAKPQKPQPVNPITTKPEPTITEPAKDPQPIIEEMEQNDQELVAENIQPDTIQQPVIAEVSKETEQGTVIKDIDEVPEPTRTELPGNHKTAKPGKLLASVIGQKPAIISGLESAVNEKLVAAKELKEDLKNTEVKFRIGQKELFTVRL